VLSEVVLSLRSAGVAGELLFPAVDLVAAVLYPVLVAGPPLLLRARARQRPRPGRAAGRGFGAGYVLGFGFVSIQVVSIRHLAHRISLLAATVSSHSTTPSI